MVIETSIAPFSASFTIAEATGPGRPFIFVTSNLLQE